MSPSNSSELQEAPCASYTASDATIASKSDPGNTDLTHQLKIRACMLQQIQFLCAHAAAGPAAQVCTADGDDFGAEVGGRGSRILVVKNPDLPANRANASGDEPTDGTKVLGIVPSGPTPPSSRSVSLMGGAIKITLEDQHGDPKLGDMVALECVGIGLCRKHSLWTITDRAKPPATICGHKITYNFLPPVPDQTLIGFVFQARWLKNVQPRIFGVKCKTCKGSDNLDPVEIHVYPNESSSASFDFGKPEEHDKLPPTGHTLSKLVGQFVTTLELIADVFQVDPWAFLEPPRGSLKISNYWKEDSKSCAAYWGGSVDVGIDPIVEFKFNITLVPGLAVFNKLPACVKKYANIDVYLELTGGAKITASFEWQMKAGNTHLFRDGKGTVGGDLKLELGCKAWAGANPDDPDDAVILVTLHFNTTLAADGSLAITDEAEVMIEGGFSWGGITGTAAVAFWHGRIEADTTCTLVDGGKKKFGPHVFFEHESADSRPEDGS